MHAVNIKLYLPNVLWVAFSIITHESCIIIYFSICIIITPGGSFVPSHSSGFFLCDLFTVFEIQRPQRIDSSTSSSFIKWKWVAQGWYLHTFIVLAHFYCGVEKRNKFGFETIHFFGGGTDRPGWSHAINISRFNLERFLCGCCLQHLVSVLLALFPNGNIYDVFSAAGINT
jgi:hypothetical protein